MTPTPNSNPPTETAMAAAREMLQMDGVLTTYRCAGKGHGAEEQVAAIIQRHFSASLASVEGERDAAVAAHGVVWNAVRKAVQAFNWLGAPKLHPSIDQEVSACEEAVKLVPKWSTDWAIIPKLELAALRADLAAKGEALGSVWVVTWAECDTRRSGIHGLFRSESDALKAVERYNRKNTKSVYRAEDWIVSTLAARASGKDGKGEKS